MVLFLFKLLLSSLKCSFLLVLMEHLWVHEKINTALNPMVFLPSQYRLVLRNWWENPANYANPAEFSSIFDRDCRLRSHILARARVVVASASGKMSAVLRSEHVVAPARNERVKHKTWHLWEVITRTLISTARACPEKQNPEEAQHLDHEILKHMVCQNEEVHENDTKDREKTNSSIMAAQSGRKSRWVSPAPCMPMNMSELWVEFSWLRNGTRLNSDADSNSETSEAATHPL